MQMADFESLLSVFDTVGFQISNGQYMKEYESTNPYKYQSNW